MKYGPVICDPNSEEAKRLIGKKVITNDCYSYISDPNNVFDHKVLKKIDARYSSPFFAEYNNANWGSTFIREVIEEKPKYRPYKDTEEMVEDFCERFGRLKPATTMPFVWIENKLSKRVFMITGFGSSGVDIFCASLEWKELFDHYTYLDGSPVGKEVQ